MTVTVVVKALVTSRQRSRNSCLAPPVRSDKVIYARRSGRRMHRLRQMPFRNGAER
jgi:hypothetical protein